MPATFILAAMRFVLFDAYGTLVELDDFYGRLQRGFAARGVILPPAVVTHAARAEMQHYIAHTVNARTEADWMNLKKDCARVLAENIRTQDFLLDLEDEKVLRVLDAALVFHTFPEVIDTLAALKMRGVGMGVLSNWDGSLRHVLRDLNLIEYFDFVLISAEVGIQKPQREIFQLALQQAQQKHAALQATDCFYVGDHYDGDVAGARNAGLTPVWLVRDQRDLASGEMREDDEVLRIASLRQLVELV